MYTYTYEYDTDFQKIVIHDRLTSCRFLQKSNQIILSNHSYDSRFFSKCPIRPT